MATKRLLGLSWVSVCVYGLVRNQGGENIDPIFFHTALRLKFFLWVLRGVLLFSLHLPTSCRSCQEKVGLKRLQGHFSPSWQPHLYKEAAATVLTPFKSSLRTALRGGVSKTQMRRCPIHGDWVSTLLVCVLGLEMAQAWYCAGHNNGRIYICGKL